MRFLEKWCNHVQNDLFISVLVGTGIAIVVAAFLLSLWLKSEGLYFALLVTAFSFAVLSVICNGESGRVCIFSLSVLVVIGGVGYLFLFGILRICKYRVKRKEERAERLRKVEYTLPKNEYVRSRLEKVLDGEDEELAKRECKLSHARKLLAKVKEAPLSVAERLETEELGRALALFVQKDRWTAVDMQRANELFARILKLSGKYAI